MSVLALAFTTVSAKETSRRRSNHTLSHCTHRARSRLSTMCRTPRAFTTPHCKRTSKSLNELGKNEHPLFLAPTVTSCGTWWKSCQLTKSCLRSREQARQWCCKNTSRKARRTRPRDPKRRQKILSFRNLRGEESIKRGEIIMELRGMMMSWATLAKMKMRTTQV